MLRKHLCLACAETWSVAASEEASLCPACGTANRAAQQDFLLGYARDVVHFGHQYREKYESDIEETAHRRYFLVPPPEWLVFVAMAVLSGVIGNASYDTIKGVVARILSRQDSATQTAVDDAFLRKLDGQFREYLTRLRNVPAPVRSAILEEVLVDLMEEYQTVHPELRAKLDALTPGSEEAIKLVEQWRDGAIEMGRERAKPEPEDFVGLWKRLPRPDA
jgi:hypothetical protein